MSTGLRYPLWKAAGGTTAGWSAWAAARLLMLLPDAPLARVFRFAGWALRRLAGETPMVRSLADLDFVFARGGPHAASFRNLITRSRPEDLVAVVRGAVIRWLP